MVGPLARMVDARLRHAPQFNAKRPYDWLEVAEVYAEAGRHGEALDWAERGVAAFPDHHDPRLDEFLCAAYHQAGRHAEAIDLAWRRFESRPDLASYQRLAANATEAGEWPEWRPKAIAALRRRIERPPAQADTRPTRRRGAAAEPAGAMNLVEVLLWEGDPDGAWHEAVESSVPHRLWMRLAAVRECKHPDDAVPIFQREIERLIDAKNNRGYADAVALMDHVRELLVQAGRAEAFAPYAERVRAAHKPKRNLMGLFDAKGW